LADTGLVRAADTVLVVSGNTSAESSQGIVFDMAALQNLPSTKITTSNPWIKGAAEFTGVRISALLESVGAQTNDIEARAANEYKFKLTGIDFDKYPIIIAYLKDGNPMEFRELGPLWIIFPFDDFPELLTSKNKAASVWQLTDIELQTRSSGVVPGTFNSLNQVDRNLDNLSLALHEYQHAVLTDDPSSQQWKNNYINQFNIAWGNIQVFRPAFQENPIALDQVALFKKNADTFLTNNESLFNTQYSLSNNELTKLINETQSLRTAVHNLSQQYYYQSLNYKDTWVEKLGSLNQLLWIVSGVLFIAASGCVADVLNKRQKIRLSRPQVMTSDNPYTHWDYF